MKCRRHPQPSAGANRAIGHDDTVVRTWHAALAAIAAFALVGQTVLSASSDDRSVVNLYSYFTIQSNLLVLVAAVMVVVRPDRDERWFAVVRLAGLVGISVTGVVFAVVLAGQFEMSGIEWWYDRAFHYVVPLMAVIGYVGFRPRTRLVRRDLAFIAWPVAWLTYTLVRAEVGEPAYPTGAGDATRRVPYDFLDVADLGAGQVAINAVVVTALMLGIAWVFLWVSAQSEHRHAVET